MDVEIPEEIIILTDWFVLKSAINLPIPHLPEYSQWRVLLGSKHRRVKCEPESKQLQCRLYPSPWEFLFPPERETDKAAFLSLWQPHHQGWRANVPERVAGPSRLCGCCECEDVSELSNWWIHLAGKIGAVITPPRQGCFVSGKSRKTLLCWSRWAFNDQPHSVAKNSNTVSNTYILSLNSQKQGCCTWISKPPHQSAVKFANWRWTQKNFPNTAPEMLAILGNIYETFVEH